MPRLPRSPLLLAVVVALVPVAALAVALGPLHHDARSAVSAPAPSPSATPRSARLPRLVVADDATLGAPRAYGPLDVTTIDHHADVRITGYTLAAAPSLPDAAPVWRLRGFANLPTTALQARLGVSPPTPEFPGDKFDGLIDISQGRVAVSSGTQTANLNAGVRISDDASAVTAVTVLLDSLGIKPQSVAGTATVIDPLPVTTWRVTFTRRPIEALPVGFGTTTAAQVDITQLGNVTRLFVDAPSLAGGSTYPLRTLQDAWRDVSGGRWFDECCEVFTGAAPGPSPIAFRADSVTLVEQPLDPPQLYLVPMYVFTDSAHQLSLAVPALQAADLSEPGGFRLTAPGQG